MECRHWVDASSLFTLICLNIPPVDKQLQIEFKNNPNHIGSIVITYEEVITGEEAQWVIRCDTVQAYSWSRCFLAYMYTCQHLPLETLLWFTHSHQVSLCCLLFYPSLSPSLLKLRTLLPQQHFVDFQLCFPPSKVCVELESMAVPDCIFLSSLPAGSAPS